MSMINTIKSLKTKTLVALYNKLTRKQTKKFASRAKGEAQVIGASKVAGQETVTKFLKELGVEVKDNKYTPKDPRTAVNAPKVSQPVPEPTKRTRKHRGTNLAAPPGAPVACREGSKQAALLDMLSQPNGATMDELFEGLKFGKKPWLPQTIRWGFSWDMKGKGYGVRSTFDEDGTERFFIVIPEGYSIPPHRPLKKRS